MIRELTAADVSAIPAASPPRGWIAEGRDSAVEGVMLDVEGRRGDLLAEHWWATSPRVLSELYAAAAEVWIAAGITTHRMIAASVDPAADALVDLGFGHQQAFASHPVEALRARLRTGRQSTVTVRAVSAEELEQLTALVPLVSHHQAGPPVFAPRAPEFFAQLPGSVAEHLDDPSGGAWMAWSGESPVGFALSECSEDTVELVLVGVTPAARQSGAASALVATAVQWAQERDATTAIVDWRTTNTVAATFWAGLGFVPSEYRWARTIDLTPA